MVVENGSKIALHKPDHRRIDLGDDGDGRTLEERYQLYPTIKYLCLHYFENFPNVNRIFLFYK